MMEIPFFAVTEEIVLSMQQNQSDADCFLWLQGNCASWSCIALVYSVQLVHNFLAKFNIPQVR
jgi:hypothetical protein